MLRKMNWQMAAACGIVLVVTSAASAQRGRGGFGGDSTTGLLRSDAVLAELKVTDEQKAEIDKILEQPRGERPQINFRELSEEERREKFAELREAAQKRSAEAMTKIEGALDADQVKRLKQLAVQSQGLRALASDDVAKSLKLSSEQQEKIAAAFEKSSQQLRELFQGGNREGAREKMAELRQQTEESVLGVLSDEQKKEFENLKGEAFEFPRRTFGEGGRPRQREGDRPNRRPEAE